MILEIISSICSSKINNHVSTVVNVKNQGESKMKNLLRVLLMLVLCLSLSHSYAANLNTSSNNIRPNNTADELAVVTYAGNYEQEKAIKALITSIRKFGGKYSMSKIYVVTSNAEKLPCHSLKEKNVIVLPVDMKAEFKRYPLAIKAFAAAQVEKEVGKKVTTLVWFDPGTILLKSMDEYALENKFKAALRPVSLTNNIGIPPGEAPNNYWQPIYKKSGLDYKTLPTIKTVVDEVEIQPYYNCEIYSVDPRLGILTEWANLLTVFLNDQKYQEEACTTFLRRLFLHQAVLSAVISSKVQEDDIKPLSITSSYPFNQHNDVSEEKKIASLNEATAVIFDYAWYRIRTWMNRIPIEEPLKSWLFDTYLDYLKLADNLYRIEGSCNSYLITTDEGSVLIDPAGASVAPEFFKSIMKKYPLKAILLTHAHQDHSDDISKWKGEADIPVIAQRKLVEYFDYQARLAGHFARRNAIWAGQPFPTEPPAPKTNSRNEPTILFVDNYEYELGGIHFNMIHTPGETPDHTTIWVPELEAVFVGDNYFAYFINNVTFRGTMIRPVLGYLAALDTALAFNPEYFLMGHDAPIISKELIQDTVGKFRDAIRYIHDETVKGINQGKDVYTLMQEVKVPAEYDIIQGFGKVAWTVRGIYQEYIGWFDENPANMYELSASSIYADLVQISGGPEVIIKKAEDYFQNGEYVKVLHLMDVIKEADPTYKPMWEIRIKTYEALKRGPYNFIERLFLDHGIRTAKENLEL